MEDSNFKMVSIEVSDFLYDHLLKIKKEKNLSTIDDAVMYLAIKDD